MIMGIMTQMNVKKKSMGPTVKLLFGVSEMVPGQGTLDLSVRV